MTATAIQPNSDTSLAVDALRLATADPARVEREPGKTEERDGEQEDE